MKRMLCTGAAMLGLLFLGGFAVADENDCPNLGCDGQYSSCEFEPGVKCVISTTCQNYDCQ